MVDVLAIDQNYDIVTRYGQAFRRKFVFDNFDNDYPSHQLHHCTDQDATRAAVDAVFRDFPVKFVSAMGHGLYDSFTGQNGAVLWDADDDLSHLRAAIVHLLSCKTGAVLGRRMVEAGAAAFWGYTVSFSFFHKKEMAEPLENDQTAEVFFRMDAIIDRGVLAGKTSEEIYGSVTAYVGKILLKLPQVHQAVILDNYYHLVCPATTWGSPDVTLAASDSP